MASSQWADLVFIPIQNACIGVGLNHGAAASQGLGSQLIAGLQKHNPGVLVFSEQLLLRRQDLKRTWILVADTVD